MALDKVENKAIHESREIPQETKKQTPPQSNWNGRAVILLMGAGIAFAAVIAVAELTAFVYECISDKFQHQGKDSWETLARNKFNDCHSLVNKIKLLSAHGLDYMRVFKRLALCEEAEKEVMTSLENRFDLSPEQIKEILMGAHVRLDDNGETYSEWVKKIQNAKPRISSHPSDANVNQYSIQGQLVKELLFSCITDTDPVTGKQKLYTWFQLENHPVSLGHIFRHLVDYLKYKATQHNQGPYGSSPATHDNPILIKPKL